MHFRWTSLQLTSNLPLKAIDFLWVVVQEYRLVAPPRFQDNYGQLWPTDHRIISYLKVETSSPPSSLVNKLIQALTLVTISPKRGPNIFSFLE